MSSLTEILGTLSRQATDLETLAKGESINIWPEDAVRLREAITLIAPMLIEEAGFQAFQTRHPNTTDPRAVWAEACLWQRTVLATPLVHKPPC
jgi:hypothetical protein